MNTNRLRSLFLGLVCLALAVAALFLALIREASPRYLVSALLAALLGGVELWQALARRPLAEEIAPRPDERDLFIAAQSGHLTLRILNALLLAGVLLALMGYGLTKAAVWMAAALTLCGVLLVVFLVLLGANCYYERKY